MRSPWDPIWDNMTDRNWNSSCPENPSLGIHVCYLAFRGSGLCGHPYLGYQKLSGQGLAADPFQMRHIVVRVLSNNIYRFKGWTEITCICVNAILEYLFQQGQFWKKCDLCESSFKIHRLFVRATLDILIFLKDKHFVWGKSWSVKAILTHP